MKTIKALIVATAVAGLFACSRSGEGWTIEGTIAGAADTTLFVEASNFNNWYVIDSVEINADGTFKYTAATPDTIGSIYRVRLGREYIYFPAANTETIKLTADSKHFSRGFSLSGSGAAEGFARVDSLINSSVDKLGIDGTLVNKDLRTQLNIMVNQDTTCLVSYYIINKRIGARFVPLYNIIDRKDLATLGNVANNFNRLRPNDPRTKDLETLFINAKREITKRTGIGSVRTIEVDPSQAVGRPKANIAFYDPKGQLQDFEKTVTRGGVTILNFTRYDGEASPANTVELNKVYERYHDAGVQIYQISYDPDELFWRRNAMNMPWISVWATGDDGLNAMIAYNVNPLENAPTSFVFDRNGQLVERVTDPTKLPAIIASLL